MERGEKGTKIRNLSLGQLKGITRQYERLANKSKKNIESEHLKIINMLKFSLCFTFWGLCDIIYMSRMNLERNIFDWLVNLNSFSTNEIVASQSKIFF